MKHSPQGLPHWLEATSALLGLVAASPLLLVAAVMIAVSSRGPIIYRQERVGRGGRRFTMYKFRTMRTATGGPQVTARGDNRVTSVGKLLRKSKVDELPELWNVVKGDMSLVGPRPEVPRYELDTDLWRKVIAARPGITDPVTLVLRNEEDLLGEVEGDAELFYRSVLQPYKLLYYAKYLRERSAWSDLKVLFSTVFSVVFPAMAPAPKKEDIVAWTREQQASLSAHPAQSVESSC